MVNSDRWQLLKYGLLTVLVVAMWFALTALSHNWLVQVALGWIGVAALALYWRWLLRNKVRPPKS